MHTEPYRPTRREERRTQTVQEIKGLAMQQISSGGPDAVSLSGIVREMSMSPAAIYRYFESRDALLADLVVDAYSDFADFLIDIPAGRRSAEEHLLAVLNGVRTWAVEHANAYRLIFQTSLGSGQELAADRTVSAASRSMAALIAALTAASDQSESATTNASAGTAAVNPSPSTLDKEIDRWAHRSGMTDVAPRIVLLGLRSWTRLHGIISLELGGHLAATGIDAALLYRTEAAELVLAATAGHRRA